MSRAVLLAFCPAALLLLAACHASYTQQESLDSVTLVQYRTATNAIDNFRQLFNASDCQAIYSQAAPEFRTQRLPDWIDRCEQLRQDLGIWEGFQAPQESMCGPTTRVLCLEGTATFAKGPYHMIITLAMNGVSAHLVFLSMGREGAYQEEIPPQPDYLLDPPPPQKSKSQA